VKRGFVGLSTPLGYDYLNPIREGQGSSLDVPNPFVESVNGLLLSYDEIWFPSRDFCPKDLHHLDYVRFLEDFSSVKERALVAVEQAQDAFLPEDIPVPDVGLMEKQRQMVMDSVPAIGLDNHGRDSEFGIGNSADGELFVSDLLMAASLDFEVDVIVNSALAGSIHALEVGDKVHQIDQGFVPRAMEDIACVRSLDFVTSTGSYHESIEDLRGHARIVEFRQYLGQEAPNQKDFVGLVAEVNRQVDSYAAMAMDKYLKGNGMLFTAGSATVGALGNLAFPVVGSVLSGAFSVAKYLQQGAGRKKVGWSMFVLDTRRNQSSRGRR
jgi:hypothetical protein